MAETNIIDELKSLNQNLSLNIERLQAENDQLKVLNQSLTTKNNELEKEILRQSKAVSLKIFLAGSTVELVEEREALFKLIESENKDREKSNQYIELYWCENSTYQSQKEFNKAIRDCNIFLLLYHNKVWKDTVKEYEIAYTLSTFTEHWPTILMYEKPADLRPTLENSELLKSRWYFEEKYVKARKHHPDPIPDANELILRIRKVIDNYFKTK